MTEPVTPAPKVAATVHRAGTGRTVRAAGRVWIGAAVLVVLAVVLQLPAAGWAHRMSVVLVVVAVLAALVAAVRTLQIATGHGPRLELTAAGFRNRTRPPLPMPRGRASRASGAWTDVRRLQAVREGGRRLLVLTFNDDARSVVLLRRLSSSPADVEADIRARLDAANGYRPYGVLGAPPKAPRPR